MALSSQGCYFKGWSLRTRFFGIILFHSHKNVVGMVMMASLVRRHILSSLLVFFTFAFSKKKLCKCSPHCLMLGLQTSIKFCIQVLLLQCAYKGSAVAIYFVEKQNQNTLLFFWSMHFSSRFSLYLTFW